MKYSCLQANENRDITCHYTEKRFYKMTIILVFQVSKLILSKPKIGHMVWQIVDWGLITKPCAEGFRFGFKQLLEMADCL